MANDLLKQELRSSFLGVGDTFQPLDATGAALGAYFLFAGITNRAPPALTALLGGIMIFVHLQKFFFAPKDRTGLIRLAKALDLTQADFDAIEIELLRDGAL